jgi:hypothetical protein
MRDEDERLMLDRLTAPARRQRERVRRRHRRLFEEVSSLLYEADPIGISFGDNTDEYDPEAGTIIPRLEQCASADDVCSAVHEEFVGWFGEDAGTRERYREVSERIWRAWTRRRGR